MKSLLIAAAEILVGIFVIISFIVFGLISFMSISILFAGLLFLFVVMEIFAIVAAAFCLSGAVVMKASQEILKKSEDE